MGGSGVRISTGSIQRRRQQYRPIEGKVNVGGEFGTPEGWTNLQPHKGPRPLDIPNPLKKTRKHSYSNVKDIDAYNDIENFLGTGKQTDKNPFTGQKEANRIFVKQPEGTVKSVRIGAHEMKKDVGKGFHYHLETWDSSGKVIKPDQSVHVLKTKIRR